jgi:O-antigen/teichoic acid export membrane protein
MGALFLLWLAGAGIVGLFHGSIIERWQIANPTALWITVVVVLGCLWLPVVLGLLQGAQDFLWLGLMAILQGVGRFGIAALLVFLLHGQAAGIMVAVFAGFVLSFGVGAWQTRALWSGPTEPADRMALVRQVVPLMLGFGATFFLFTADTMFVKGTFPVQAPAYVAAGTLCRALVWLVLPVSAVMFPKLVHSTVRSQKSNLMVVTLGCTAMLAAGGALGLWLVAPWVVPFVFPSDYLANATIILPWYAGAMIPLSLANVLVNDLLARGQYRVVPWMVAVAAVYGVTLSRLHTRLVQVPQALAAFCAVLFVVCAWFAWSKRAKQATA